MFDSVINWYDGTPHYTFPVLDWNGGAYGNGRFVCMDRYSKLAQYSTDNGVNWLAGKSPGVGQFAESIAFGKGVFVSSSGHYSSDGITWFQISNNGSMLWNDIFFNGVNFVARTFAGALYSTNGMIWNSSSLLPGTSNNLTGLGPFMGVSGQIRTTGHNPFYISRLEAEFRSSDNGVTWSAPIAIPGGFPVGSICAAGIPSGSTSVNWIYLHGMKFARAVGSGTYTVGNLPQSFQGGALASVGLWSSFVYGNGVFVAVPESYVGGGLVDWIIYSTNGLNWNVVFIDGLFSGVFESAQRYVYAKTFVMWGNNRFIIMSPNGATWYSNNGATWTPGWSVESITTPLALRSIYPFCLSHILNVPAEFVAVDDPSANAGCNAAVYPPDQWAPDPATTCATSFYQYNPGTIPGCPPAKRLMTGPGTQYPDDQWGPDPATKCGPFYQYNYGTIPGCDIAERLAQGTCPNCVQVWYGYWGEEGSTLECFA